MAEQPRYPCVYPPPESLFFLIAGNWDVYTNTAMLEPWWRLGNLRQEPLTTILDRYTNSVPLGYHTVYTLPARDLARRYADPEGERVYSDAGDLLALYVAKYCLAQRREDMKTLRYREST
jgi:hypothetical protein